MTDGTDLWERLSTIPDEELAALTETALAVLGSENPQALAAARLPSAPLMRELEAELRGRGVRDSENVVRRIVSDAAARSVAIGLLEAIAGEADLRTEVEAAYRQRKGLMVIDVGVVAAAALLLLVLKLKKVKMGKGNVEVDLASVSNGALKSVLQFVGM